MTLDKDVDHNFQTSRYCKSNMIKMDSAMALREVLLSAKLEERITYGVYQSVRKLGSDPDNVMLCIHADGSTEEDVALHIHFTLMEAFCRENAIRLIKVGCHERLAKLIGDVNPIPVDNEVTPGPRASTEDFVCLLVDFPKEMDVVTNCFLEHYHSMAQEVVFPHVSLDV